jgi:hypothetical protein
MCDGSENLGARGWKTDRMAGQLVPSHRVSEADWYGAGLNGFGGRVDQVIPRGYPAYARILHPAEDEHGDPVRWSDVAAWSGRVLHRLAQFDAIAGRWYDQRRKGVGWPGRNPGQGSLTWQQLRVLCHILACHTATADQCWLNVWEGFGNLPQEWERTAPRVHQPGRAYYIFQRPLGDVLEFSARVHEVGWDQDPLPPTMARIVLPGPSMVEKRSDQAEPRNEDPWIQSPNQWWPSDRAWCVASEIDFDSTLVAGTQALVEQITRHPDLEAVQVNPTDDLTINGDNINPLPPRAR